MIKPGQGRGGFQFFDLPEIPAGDQCVPAGESQEKQQAGPNGKLWCFRRLVGAVYEQGDNKKYEVTKHIVDVSAVVYPRYTCSEIR